MHSAVSTIRLCRRLSPGGVFSVVLAGLLAAAQPVLADPASTGRPDTSRYLTSGRLAEGDVALTGYVTAHPDDQQALHELGTLQFLQAVERLTQGLYRIGLSYNVPFLELPILRMPLPLHPHPEPATYEKLRAIYAAFQADLLKAEATLARVTAVDVKYHLPLGKVLLDIDADGKPSDRENLSELISALLLPGGANQKPDLSGLVVGWDYADALWLRGYCHVLLTLTDIILAHDWRPAFDATAQIFFASSETPFNRRVVGKPADISMDTITDLIALFHLMSFDVVEPERMKSAWNHLGQVIALSRKNLEAIEAETDNDAEWLPAPTQASVFPRMTITAGQLAGWREFLTEMEALLEGRKLLGHWRINNKGINLKRVFHEPRRLDLILWVQGTAALPYLEEGPTTDRALLNRLQQLFSGRFFSFAVWIN